MVVVCHPELSCGVLALLEQLRASQVADCVLVVDLLGNVPLPVCVKLSRQALDLRLATADAESLLVTGLLVLVVSLLIQFLGDHALLVEGDLLPELGDSLEDVGVGGQVILEVVDRPWHLQAVVWVAAGSVSRACKSGLPQRTLLCQGCVLEHRCLVASEKVCDVALGGFGLRGRRHSFSDHYLGMKSSCVGVRLTVVLSIITVSNEVTFSSILSTSLAYSSMRCASPG